MQAEARIIEAERQRLTHRSGEAFDRVEVLTFIPALILGK